VFRQPSTKVSIRGRLEHDALLVTPRPAVGPKHPSSHSVAENLPPDVKLSAHLNLVLRFRIRTFMPQFPPLLARRHLSLSAATAWFTLYSMLNYVKIILT